jgi:subtilisin family serine protease
MSLGKSPRLRAGLCAILTLSLAWAVAPAAATSGGEAARLSRAISGGADTYAPGEAIVRFEPDTVPDERRQARLDARVGSASALGLPWTQLVEVEGSVSAAVRRLERQPGVAYAQPNYFYEALAVEVEPPNDTFFGDLWGLSDPSLLNPGVSALEAWEVSRGAGQTVAVVDTGVDLTHPDIAGNLWTNPSPGPDGDLHGYDFVDEDGSPDDYQFHGTHVAATVAAVAGNGLGIAGVAPEAKIMAVRALDGDGSGFTADIAAGIAYAAEHGAGVINLSLGGPAGEDEATEDAIELAGAEGAVVVAAAGNEGVDNDIDPHTPCALPQPNLICVAALTQGGSLAGFSNYGAESVDLAAPGTNILSAKTDYGPPLFSDGFESGLKSWTTQVFEGGVPWGTSSSAASGLKSATDSPGGSYGQAPTSSTTAASELFTTAAVDLGGERGCRLHFRTKYRIEPLFDVFFAGASEGSDFDGLGFDGTSAGFPGTFAREEASVSKMDGRSDVHPIFAVLSDESEQFDGAYVDDVRLFCRDGTYEDKAVESIDEYDQPNSGNYVRFNGTSMATPHVAGVVALVRAAAPGLGVQQVVDAVLTGTSAMPSPNSGKPTATFGIADACKAIAVATGGDAAAECPGSSQPSVPEAPGEGGQGGGTVPPPIPPAPDVQTPNAFSPAGAPRSADRTRPRTFFRKRPGKVIWTRGRRARAVFRFAATEAGATFSCRIDRGSWRQCPPRLLRRFGLGHHVLRVVARDPDGNADPTPAVHRFRVMRLRRGA